MALVGLGSAYLCTAPYQNWSPICLAKTQITGAQGTSVQYKITISDSKVNLDTVICQLWGGANLSRQDNCSWGWHDIRGLSSGNLDLILWDSKTDFPAIRCKSLDKIVQLEWTFEVGMSKMTCEKGSHFNHLINFEGRDKMETTFD